MYSSTSTFLARMKAVLPFPSRTVLTALLKVLPADRVLPALRQVTEPAELLEFLAKTQHLNRKKLLELVAGQMGIRSQTPLEIPSQELIAQTGLNAEELAAMNAVPQFSQVSRSGYVLVTADPAVSQLEQLRKRKVPVLLGLRAEILGAWEKFRILQGSARSKALPTGATLSPSLQFVVRKLAADCQQLGAHEVFLGHPEPTKYECFAQNRVYSGSIHRELFDQTLHELQLSGRISLEPVDPLVGTIHLSPTKSFQQLVICVTWDGPVQHVGPAPKLEPPPQPQPQPEPTVVEALPALEPAQTSGASKPQLVEQLVTNVEKPSEVELLLVDDDDRFSLLLSTILKAKGYIVSRAANGMLALELIRSGGVRPTVIVCDVHMPALDGPGFIKALRAEGHQQPVLVLTSDEDRLVEAELALLGADAYVQKREDPRVLIAWIKNLCQRAKRLREHVA